MDAAVKKASQTILIALAASVPVLFRGLFFSQDYFIFAILAFLWVISCVTLSGISLRFESAMDIALGLLTLSYVFSAAFAVSSYAAIFEASKYILFYLIYLLTKSVFKKTEHIQRTLSIIVLLLALNAGISLLTAAGILHFPGAYSASEIEKWLNGTVQYHNAFGLLMLIGYFITSSLQNGSFKSLSFALNGVYSYLFMFGLLMSYSRGAWVLVPVLFVLFMIFAARQTKIRFFATGFASLLSSIVCLSKFAAFVDAQNKTGAVLTLICGLILCMALYYAFHFVLEKLSSKPHFAAVGISCIVVLVLLAAIVVLFPSAFPFLPAQLAERLAGINFSTGTVQERFVFYNDAFNLYKNHNLVLGSGGGAWQYLYGMYQSYLYFSTQAHSYIMQILVETGAFGFISWLGVIVLFYIQCFKAKKSGKIGKDLLCAICCAGSALILHSFVDFDLSIPAILLMLWCLLGILDGISPLSYKGINVNKWAAVVISSALCIFSIFGLIGCISYEKGNITLQQDENYANAYDYFKTAAAVMPINAEYQSAFLNARASMESVSPEDMEQIIQRDKYNKNVYENAFYFYDALKDYEKALDCVNSLISIQPLNLEHYISLASVSNPAIQQALSQTDFKKAASIAKNMLDKKETILAAAGNDEAVKRAVLKSIEYAETIYTTLQGIE